MPALVICGRRSNLGGDDLQPIAILTIILRFIQLGLSTPVAIFLGYNYTIWQQVDEGVAYTEPGVKNCKQVQDEVQLYATWCWTYLAAIFLFCVCSVTQEFSMLVASCIGSPSDNTLRQTAIGPLYAIKFFLMPPFEAFIFLMAFLIMVFTRDDLLRCLALIDGDDGLWLERHLWGLLSCILGILLTMAIELVVYGILYFTRAGGLLWNKASNQVKQRKRRKRLIMQQRALENTAMGSSNPYLYNPGTNAIDADELDILDEEELLQQKDELWQKRCTRLCCCCGALCCCFACFGGTDIDQHDFASVGHILTDLFDDDGNLDIVASDVYMAWQLLKLVQRQRCYNDNDDRRKSSSSGSDTIDHVDEENNQRGRRRQDNRISELLLSIRSVQQQDTENNILNSDLSGNKNAASNHGVDRTTTTATTPPQLQTEPHQETALEQHQALEPVSDKVEEEMGERNNSNIEHTAININDDNMILNDNGSIPQPDAPSHSSFQNTTGESITIQQQVTKGCPSPSGRNDPYNKNNKYLSKDSSEEEKRIIAEAAWFIRYPMAINTWKLYVFMHPFKCLPMCITSNHRYRSRVKLIVGTKKTSGSNNSSTTPNRQHTKFSDNVEDEDRDIEIATQPSSPLSTTHNGSSMDHHEAFDDDDVSPDDNNNTMEELFIGDHIGDIHRKAFLDFIEADKYPIDIPFVQVHNSVEVSPYCICVDHVWETIVICIRGSLSLEDYAINVMVDPEPLDEIGERYGFDGTGEYCHKGFLERAMWVCEDIDRQGILAKLIGNDPKRTSLFPNYTLHVVGHSLGAAVACLVAMMLRSKFTKLKCLCFGPPGALVSKGLALKCHDFCTTYVAGDDVVPSLSVDNVELLRNELLTLVVRTKVPKNFAIRKCWWYQRKRKWQEDKRKKCTNIKKSTDNNNNNNNINHNDDDNEQDEQSSEGFNHKKQLDELIRQLLYEEHDFPDSDCKRQVENFLHHQQIRQHDRELNNSRLTRIPLYPPGRVVCATKRYGCSQNKQSSTPPSSSPFCSQIFGNCCDSSSRNKNTAQQKQYVATWANNDDFNEILLTDDMFAHHFPATYETHYRGVASHLGVDYTQGAAGKHNRKKR